MKGDFTRMTFDPKKHYSRVLMQQGRVQLDADWNEQLDIGTHRVEIETLDVIGACGTPLAQPGFTLIVDASQLPAADQTRLTQLKVLPLQAGDFLIGPGRYYVDGKLCENEDYAPYTRQPDLPGDDPKKAPSQPDLEINPIADDGLYLAYLDMWDRHITALDDDLIREKALGGPDTATRAKTIWQVKLQKLDSNQYNCATAPQLTDDSTGQLSARAQPADNPANECEVPPGAGYRRLENQLYRVEIHTHGDEKSATFKWSRDNASMVTTWKSKNGNDLTVGSGGPDQVLGFAPNQWIELSDDTRELQGKSGTLVRLTNAVGQVLTIDPTTATGPIELNYFPLNPKVRRWDTISTNGVRNVDDSDTADHFIQLEDGVEIKFEKGHYNTGDYWLIPARTATADVEWPRDDSHNPIPQPKGGIYHHLCNLGLLKFVKASKQLALTDDCRTKFPTLTDLLCLYCVSGDGQEAAPGQKLPYPLQVGVSNGNQPVKDARVRFTVTGGGSLSVTQPVPTNNQGLAQCEWTLGSTGDQHVVAELIDSNNQRIHLPVVFNAQFAQTGDGAQPGIQVESIAFLAGTLVNDTNVSVDVLASGLAITCSANVSQLSVRSQPTSTAGTEISPTVFVTLDLPYPFNDADVQLWGPAIVAFQPVILAANVNGEGQVISWVPTPHTNTWLQQQLFPEMTKRQRGERILAHLTLKGNFIWASSSNDLYLDGEVFGVAGQDPATGAQFNAAKLPSGNQRRGGDCELWFWLTAPQESKQVILIGNVKSPALAKLSATRRTALAQVVNLALDRAALRNVVPPNYALNLNQAPDVAQAQALAVKNKLQGLSFNAWASAPFGEVGLMVRDMLKQIEINLDVIEVDPLLDKLQVAVAAGEVPDMVLCDDALLDQLRTLGYSFPIVTL